MIKFNDTYIIGIDHGYGNLKTANTVTASGVRVHDIEPPFKKELLEYDGKFICIGENHKSFTADKTTDMDNYYLTLYGIAKELSLAGITETNVHLAVGLPLMWYSEQRDRFSEYMMQNENVEFIYNNKKFGGVKWLICLIAGLTENIGNETAAKILWWVIVIILTALVVVIILAIMLFGGLKLLCFFTDHFDVFICKGFFSMLLADFGAIVFLGDYIRKIIPINLMITYHTVIVLYFIVRYGLPAFIPWFLDRIVELGRSLNDR